MALPIPLFTRITFHFLGLVTVLFWISPTKSSGGRAFIIFLLIFGLGSEWIGGAFHILCFRRRIDESALLTPNYGRFYSIDDTRVWWNGWMVMEEIGLYRFYIFSQREWAQKMLGFSTLSAEPLSGASA
jgi:hypothetical protein